MDEPIYTEQLKSSLTTVLFIDLSLIFFLLFGWRLPIVGWKFSTGLFLFLGLFFLFYIFNYRILRIEITQEILLLKFGMMRWRTSLSNIKGVALDESPWWIKYGGAGVHFALVQGTYQAYYNFLDGPRLRVEFKDNQGPVKALVFSTQQPEQLLEQLQRRISA